MNRFGKTMKFLCFLLFLSGCEQNIIQDRGKNEISSGYRVILSLQGSDAVMAGEGYETVVVDAQYLSAAEIASMQERGQKVFTYLNIGSLETFRSYYEEYQHLTMKPYLNWDDEYWLDVTNKEWQKFITSTLTNQLLEKGIDGFWIDNVDIYGQSPNEDIYEGVEVMLKELMSHGKPVIINGGNEFVQLYLQRNQQVDDILTGVNQETVFSSINFGEQTFGTQTSENQNYYLDYLDAMDKLEKDVFLLEYTTDSQLSKEIQRYANKRSWEYYISDSIELDGN